jgi:hypothetical protein
METNNFPDRIYIPRDVEYPQFPDIWWERDPDDESNVEYVRKDAFVEKVCVKLKKLMYDNLMFQGRLYREEVIDNFIEDFKKYMKGEKL